MFAILALILIIAIPKASYSMKTKYRKPVPIVKTDYKRQQAEIDRATKQAVKEAQQAEKNRQKKEQAEADITFYENQLNQLTGMLSQADNELNELEKQIQIDYLMRSYDRAKVKEKRKTQVVKQIMTLESRVHAIENRLAKAYYITQAV